MDRVQEPSKYDQDPSDTQSSSTVLVSRDEALAEMYNGQLGAFGPAEVFVWDNGSRR
jgi:hypothetical protein